MDLKMPKKWQRDWCVYDRAKELGIDFKTKEGVIPPVKGRRICSATFTPSGLVFLSGSVAGSGAVTNDDQAVEKGFEAGRQAGMQHAVTLHWALQPFGDLNDIWYCVKCIGMVNSHGGGAFTKSARVVDGYTSLWHDLLGGPLSRWAKDGEPDALTGWHARTAVGGFDIPGGGKIEPEMIFQIDPDLALKIIRERGPHI